jgi:hypothetical protein
LNCLVDEFDFLLNQKERMLPALNEGVIVLSAPPSLNKEDEREREANPENVARVTKGVEIARRSGAKLFLNGETEQLPWMQKIAQELYLEPERIVTIDCGARGVGNTKTQFEVMAQDNQFRSLNYLVLVTSLYHVPRVSRTGKKWMPWVNWWVCGLTLQEFPFDVPMMVGGEIRRIIEYTQKGDICW